MFNFYIKVHFNLMKKCLLDETFENLFNFGDFWPPWRQLLGYKARRPLQLLAKGAEGEIGKVPIKDRPKWPFLIVGRVAAELRPRGLLNLDQGALEEYRSRDLYKIWARRPLNFWATKGPFKKVGQMDLKYKP